MIARRSAERKFDTLSAVGDFELTCRILCQNPDGKSAFPQKRGDGLLLGDPELKAGAARRGFRPAMLNGDQIGVGPDAPAPRFRPCGADQCRVIENLAGEGGELLQIDRGSRSGDNPELTAEGNRAEIDRGVRFLEGEDSLAAGDAVPGKLKFFIYPGLLQGVGPEAAVTGDDAEMRIFRVVPHLQIGVEFEETAAPLCEFMHPVDREDIVEVAEVDEVADGAAEDRLRRGEEIPAVM